MEWIVVGELANVAQLAVSLKLIYAIVKAARNARMHKRNCLEFAAHLKMIANLLHQLKPQDVDEYGGSRETREPLDHLEQCLKRALILVQNCRDKSYLYLLVMGGSILSQFRDCQSQIDKYLQLIPLIALVENHREKLRAIERDRREYTMNEDEKRLRSTVLKERRTRDDAFVLQNSLSRSYPGFCLAMALREENEKLCYELQRKQRQMDLDQCQVIEHLIEITRTVNYIPKGESERIKFPTHSRASTMESIDSGVSMTLAQAAARMAPSPLPQLKGPDMAHVPRVPYYAPHVPVWNDGHSRGNPDNSGHSQGNDRHRRGNDACSPGNESGHGNFGSWHNGLFECCFDPCICMSTFCYPCGTFTNIATVVTDNELPRDLACHDLGFHSLYLGCCFFTCGFRRKLRKRFDIHGGCCSDCLAHMLCCCCALVQEWREIKVREEEGLKVYKMRVPPQQTMESYRPWPNPNNQERYSG